MNFIMSRIHGKWLLLRRRPCSNVRLRVCTYMHYAQVLRTGLLTRLRTMYTEYYQYTSTGGARYCMQYMGLFLAADC